jgi:Tfp pilus assembly protein PilN
MIEINLFPGGRRRKSASKSAGLELGTLLGGMSDRLRDPWLLVAIGGICLGAAAIAGMWGVQGRAVAALEEQQRIAGQDSVRFTAVLVQRRAAEARRDSLLRQIALIRAMDVDRFVWAHAVDEIVTALPTYTWLASVSPLNVPTPTGGTNTAAGGGSAVGIRVVAYTVDIQAVTIFMRQLEASPFIENVTLGTTDQVVTDGADVRQFTVDMFYAVPDSSAIRTVPLTIAVR